MEDNVQLEQNNDVDYIQAIQDLKANTVPKEQFSKLKEENAKLLKSLINGETLEGVTAPEKPDVEGLRKDLYNGIDLTNLDYVSKTLDLRDEIIANGGKDPFLPWGEKISPTQQDIEAAERVAKVLRECIDYAEGDSLRFTSELQRVMVGK